MTPAQIYAMPPVTRHRDRFSVEDLWGCYYNHVPEIEDQFVLDKAKLGAIKEITTVVHAYYSVDHRRYWAIWSAWYEGKPYMLMQNAGREGDDYRQRYVTDAELYNKALSILRSCYRDDSAEKFPLWDINKDVPEIEDFYGITIQEALGQNPPKDENG